MPMSSVDRDIAIERLTILRDDVLKNLPPNHFDIKDWGYIRQYDQLEQNLGESAFDQDNPKPQALLRLMGSESKLLKPTFSFLECDSVCCVLGSAATHKPFVEEGLRLFSPKSSHPSARPAQALWIIDTKNRTLGVDAGASFFHIPEFVSEFLFVPSSYRYMSPSSDDPEWDPENLKVTIDDAIRHIDIVLDTLHKDPAFRADFDYLTEEAILRYHD